MKKSTFLNVKLKGEQPIVPFFPNQSLVILIQANKTFQRELNFTVIWEVGVVITGCVQSKSFA